VSQVRVRMQPADSEAPRPGGSCCITVFAFVTLVFSDMIRVLGSDLQYAGIDQPEGTRLCPAKR
jgi:hypothetical protein